MDLRTTYLRCVGITLALACCFYTSNLPAANTQAKPLTYPEIMTALGSKVPNQSFKTRKDVVEFLMRQVQQRRVDKPLTASREDDLAFFVGFRGKPYDAGIVNNFIARAPSLAGWEIIADNPQR